MPDVRVQAAIDNWAPRFVAQGVDFNDFLRTTARCERWDEWLDAWCQTGDQHTALAQEAEARGRLRSAGEAYVRAALCFHFSKFVWMVDQDKNRQAADKAVSSLYQAHRLLDPSAERLEIDFEQATMVANLRRPSGEQRPALVILLPGLDSTKEEFFYWEQVFIDRGMATLSLEGPGQGETGYHTHIRHDYDVAVTQALDHLSSRQDLDLERVGIAGVSLGGYYAPRSAAFERRLKAAAAIGGPYDVGGRWDMLPPITKETYIHHSGSKSEEETRQKLLPFTLEGVMARITQPLLIVFGKLDRLIPWEQAERMAAEAPNAELVMYPEGNHVCNNIPYKYRPLVGDWMREQLVGA